MAQDSQTLPRSQQGSQAVKGDSYYGKIAQNYEARRAKQDWWAVENTQMEALLDQLPSGLTVVDVPFGTGRFVPMYLARGYSVQGLDASDAMIAQARAQLGAQFAQCETVTGTATALPFADGAFDLLVSTRFLRDIITFADAKLALAEFARVTSGHAIIQLGESTASKPASVADDEAMGSLLSARQNRHLLADAGFQVVEKRLVKSDPVAQSEIYHMLCKKI